MQSGLCVSADLSWKKGHWSTEVLCAHQILQVFVKKTGHINNMRRTNTTCPITLINYLYCFLAA
jgi:hypothetical protein